MTATPMLRRGLILAFLTCWLTACESNPVKVETVTVEKPVIVGVPDELTAQVPEPVLPAGPITNEDLASYVDRLKAWGREAYKKLEKIAGLDD